MTVTPTPYFDAGRERLAEQFREALSVGEVRVQRCRVCEGEQFPPLPTCEHCGSDNLAWQNKDRGRVVASYVGATDRHGDAVRVAVVDVGGCRVPTRVAPSESMIQPGEDVEFVPPIAPRLGSPTIVRSRRTDG